MTLIKEEMERRESDVCMRGRGQQFHRRRTLLREAHEEIRTLRKHAAVILCVVDLVEGRCLAADGPVTPTLQEMDEAELRRLWKAARAIAKGAR